LRRSVAWSPPPTRIGGVGPLDRLRVEEGVGHLHVLALIRDFLALIATPEELGYDEDVYLAQHRAMYWIGYKVHLTEACDDRLPPLIAHVETTTAPVADGDMTLVIHAAAVNGAMSAECDPPRQPLSDC
jgi:hypothetical protein